MKKNLKKLLAGKLEDWQLNLLHRSYDVVGDIAVIRLPELIKQRSKIVAEAIMQIHKQVKTVLHQASPVSGDFRLRKFEVIAGERKTETVYKEYGCLLKVDLEKCYFSPRLSYERARIARQVRPGEIVVNLFAGVGSYSIIIAKHAKAEKVYSIDINPVAIQYMQENNRLNRVEARVVPIQGDAKKIVEERLRKVADRVIMPLPERAYQYFDSALLALKPTGGRIHYYNFEHATKPEDPIAKVRRKISEKLEKLHVDFEIPFQRIVRRVGPNWFQIVLDIEVER